MSEAAWLAVKAATNLIKNAKQRKIQKAELKAAKRDLQAQERGTIIGHAREAEQLGSELSGSGVAGSPAAAERVAAQRTRHGEERSAITRGLRKIKRRKKAGRLDITSIL